MQSPTACGIYNHWQVTQQTAVTVTPWLTSQKEKSIWIIWVDPAYSPEPSNEEEGDSKEPGQTNRMPVTLKTGWAGAREQRQLLLLRRNSRGQGALRPSLQKAGLAGISSQ